MKKSEMKMNVGTLDISEASRPCTWDRREFLGLATSSSAYFFLGSRFMPGATDPANSSGERIGGPDPFDLSKWHRVDRHDGYVVGNGRMYMVAGLGWDLDLNTKSRVTSVKAPLSRIAWVIGPTYALGNLGWGWEIEAANDNGAIPWEAETIVSPSLDCPFWGVECTSPMLTMNISDIIMADHPVIVRRVTFRCPLASQAADFRLRIPVCFDPRNSGEMFSMKHDHAHANSPSLAKNRLRQAFSKEGAFVTVAAQRALYQEDSTVILDANTNCRMFPPRALATGINSPSPQVLTTLQDDAFSVELGRLAPGETREIAVWLVTVSASDSGLEAEALRELNYWRARNLTEVISEAKARPLPLLTRTDGQNDPLLHSIEASYNLAAACQARSGGVMAEPYMYPMYYVRDEYGSVRLFLARGDYDRAWGVLGFHLGMAAFFGLQNAYDTFDVPPDPTRWPRRTEASDSRFKDAEVPSYMILEARDYLRATGDLERVRPLYPQLAFNLRVQKPSVNGLFPSQGDESYSNFEETAPRFRQETTDSSLMFIAAAEFMSELAGKLGHAEDGDEFAKLARRTRDATMKRLWLLSRNYFAYARDESDDPAHIDARPVLDPVLRWDWLGMGEPSDSVSQGCLNAVLQYLINPVRVVSEDQAITAGMDPGYLLHALARAQDSRMHDAARLVLKYASAQGLYSEYYSHENGVIIPISANLRPWESGVNATALLYYLIGLKSDLLNQRVSLDPHLPPDWPGWSARPILLPGEGALHLRFERADVNGVSLFIGREGGSKTLIFDVGLGGFDQTLVQVSKPLKVLAKQPNLARGSFSIAPGESWTGSVKTNSIKETAQKGRCGIGSGSDDIRSLQ
jgi:hypothetical protein